MEEAERIEARDGTQIHLELAAAGGLRVVAEGSAERKEVVLPYPSGGIGGHRFVLSPSERWLAFAHYSGQSEEAYQLFDYPDLERRWSVNYVFGESGIGMPAFTPDEKCFVTTWATNSGLRIEDLEVRIDSGELEEGARTDRVTMVNWATLHLRRLGSGAVHECSIRVRMPAGSPDFTDPETWPELAGLTNDEVTIAVGWAEDLSLPLPPPDAVILEGPAPT